MMRPAPFTPDILQQWLPTQRWFPVRELRGLPGSVGGGIIADPEGGAQFEVNILEVQTDDGVAVVNVPLSYRTARLRGRRDALIGECVHPKLGPCWVYDAVRDPSFVRAWVNLVRASTTSEDGSLAGVSLTALPPTGGSRAPAVKVLQGEQSNTSVVIGSGQNSMIVKFFRVLAAGESPDVQISAALTAAGSHDVPDTYGWVSGNWVDPRTGSETSGHLSVVRDFLEESTDAWRAATEAVAEGRDFSREAHELGGVLARIHRQLESAFGSGVASPEETREFCTMLAGRIEWAWAEASSAVGHYGAEVTSVLEQVRTLPAIPALQRIHADLHLGQVLRTKDGAWVLLDFEGEPLRPTLERSVPDAPLRDVVGMVRSLQYAAASRPVPPEPADRQALAQWVRAATAAFLQGYTEESGTIIDPNEPLFRALWLDKALYEVVYELRNRPTWVEMPARDIRRVLSGVHVDGAAEGGNTVRSDDETGGVAGSSAGEATPGAVRGPRAEASTDGRPIPVSGDIIHQVSEGTYYQPHAVLGAHLDAADVVTVRSLRKLARSVTVVTASGRVELDHEHNGVWVGTLPAETPGHVPDYRLEVAYDGDPQLVDDPYRFLPTLGEIDLHLIGEGRHETLWTALGAHVRHYSSTLGDITGTSFAVWAPNARAVRVKADFNGWDGSVHAMRVLGSTGVWELFVPGAHAGACYKYEILGPDGQWREKADPMARGTEVPPLTGSRVVESRYAFGDDLWMRERAQSDPHNGPMSVYEVHLGSWRVGLNYRELADQLAEYVSWQGFTHVELMPVAEHPFGGSWGYQVTSYFAPTSRFGHPDDFKYLVDTLHQAGIGVIMDWVPAHFPKDEWALAKFDGATLYEHGDPWLGEHPDWGTLIFDFGRREVRNFLVANALYWLEEYHIDGLRVDAVASMLYLDYSREEGQWRPNRHGGRENLEAIAFLQEVNATAYRRVPGIVMIAEESTAFPGVTRPTSSDGLGFGLKWNMGWMHDSLEYIAEDPINRVHHHNKATFSMVYAYTENFLLPISHDEVVHGKGSLLRKMPGDRWQQLANVRAYLAFQWAHPGKQLIFMGTEFAQESEWAEQHGLDWWLCETAPHKGVQELVRALNAVYRQTPSMYSRDNDPAGFQWIDENDAAHNTLSFVRWDGQGNPLVCVANFAGGPHEGYRVGLPMAGRWKEVLNTDARAFGGSDVGNGGVVTASEGVHHGQPAYADLRLPPLGVLYLVPEKS